jgi:dihydrofolate reductase
MISIIAAIADNNAIGANNSLLWSLPNDMKRFRELTTGHTVIMGRKTFESLPKGALPNRRNVVITGNIQLSFNGCEMFDRLEEAIRRFKDENEIFIIGGASVYEQAIGLADKLYITTVHHTFDEADTFFPLIDEREWTLTEREDFPSNAKHLFPYTFKTFIKKKNNA